MRSKQSYLQANENTNVSDTKPVKRRRSRVDRSNNRYGPENDLSHQDQIDFDPSSKFIEFLTIIIVCLINFV